MSVVGKLRLRIAATVSRKALRRPGMSLLIVESRALRRKRSPNGSARLERSATPRRGEQSHGCPGGLVSIGLHRASNSRACRRFMAQAQVRQPTQNAQQNSESITCGANLEGAHQRGVQRSNIGLHHMFGNALGKQVDGSAFMQTIL